MKKSIISAQTAGISNRLKCIVTSLRVADKTKRKVLLYWPKTFDVGCEFSELFSIKVPVVKEDPAKNQDNVLCGSLEDCEKNQDKNWIFNSWRFLLFPGEIKEGFSEIFSPKKGNAIDLEFFRIPKELRKEFSDYTKKLVPQKNIQKQISDFLKNYDFKNVVGLHVRRTDFQYTLDGRGKVSTDDKFFAEMEKILSKNPETKFFLATDSSETEKKFMGKFKDKIIVYPKKGWDKSSSEFTREALIELLILSKTPNILGTYLSTFTEMAWWFGGAKAKIIIIGDDSTKKEVLKNIKSAQSVSKKPNPLRQFFKMLRARSKLFRKLIGIYYEMKISLAR